MKNFPQFCGIEQDGEWFEVYFYDRIVDEVAVPIMMRIPICRLKSYFEAQTCQEHNYGYYEDELPIISFDELVNDLHCRGDRDKYLKEIVWGIVADKEKEKQQAKDIDRLSRAYNELLEKFRELEGEKVEAPVMSIPEALFTISQNHIRNLKEEERKELTLDEEHYKGVYQTFYTPFIPKQANS